MSFLLKIMVSLYTHFYVVTDMYIFLLYIHTYTCVCIYFWEFQVFSKTKAVSNYF